MIIRSLKVTNFRNYNRFNITLGSKMNIFIGNNASGKTNILEAIASLGLTKSFKNGKVLTVDISYNSFNNQVMRASRLESIIRSRKEKAK